jgi:glycosyltransferase involved in cell wall biosynthesis
LFESVIPSKMFEAMAMARPIILGVRGDARVLLQRAGGGLDMEPGCAESLVACVMRLADDPSLRSALGASGRAFVEEHYNRDRLAGEMLGLLESVADGARNRCTLSARAADPEVR